MLTVAIPDKTLPQLNDPEQQSLVSAFSAFSSAARSLEHSYFGLGEEVRRLRKELEQERELRRRREALAEISALLAHEVRNPLGSLELFAGLLAESRLEAQEQGWVEQIQSGLRVLAATVNNVLEFHSHSPLDLAPTEINSESLAERISLRCPRCGSALARCAARARGSARRHAIARRMLDPGIVDPSRPAPAGAGVGVLLIATALEAGMVLVDFDDHGPGIPAEVLKRIFHAGVTTRTGGPGLGLAVAKKIIEQHAGTLRITSEAGGGTSFRVQLPLTGAGR